MDRPKELVPKLLVIDDEEIVRLSCRRTLESEGFDVRLAGSGDEGLRILENEGFDVVLTDLKMPDIDGLEVLHRIKSKWPETEIVIITGYGTVGSAVQAMKYGAFDYIEKPFTPDRLLEVIGRAVERKMLFIKSRKLRQEAPHLYMVENMVGTSRKIQQVFQSISIVAPTDNTALITGESGTGKELVAKAIHYNSMRKDKPFVVVDCGTIPGSLMESELFGYSKGAFTGAYENKDGLLKMANEGTIFFDEIGNLDVQMQVKLLRVLQEREFRPLGAKRPIRVDIRIIAATNSDLEAMTKEGSFREDLFYRLNIFPIHLPPLRERKEDIPALSHFFLERCKKKCTHISAEAMKLLMSSEWPGNVRQLENVIERAVLLSDGSTLREDHFSFLKQSPSSEKAGGVPRTSRELREMKKGLRSKSIEDIEKSFLIGALERNDWNITKAADDVGMQRTNFHALLRKHGITKGS